MNRSLPQAIWVGLQGMASADFRFEPCSPTILFNLN
jgi:hypothetical protein